MYTGTLTLKQKPHTAADPTKAFTKSGDAGATLAATDATISAYTHALQIQAHVSSKSKISIQVRGRSLIMELSVPPKQIEQKLSFPLPKYEKKLGSPNIRKNYRIDDSE